MIVLPQTQVGLRCYEVSKAQDSAFESNVMCIVRKLECVPRNETSAAQTGVRLEQKYFDSLILQRYPRYTGNLLSQYREGSLVASGNLSWGRHI